MKPAAATSTTEEDEARWNAVLSRDPRADGAFVYSVRTTGVYCRPMCPSRQARRENVRFYDTRVDAERAGFRPCKRCRPDREPGEARTSAVAAACRLIEEASALPTLQTLADAANLSPSHFHRLFKAATGLTPKGYAEAHRARRVREALHGGETITGAIYGAGFNSNGRFYANSSRILGMTPTDFRTGAPDATIRFAVGQCTLGSLLVAATEAGVCSILLGDDPDALVRQLQDAFPRATFVGADADFEQHVARVVGLIESPSINFDLPLDVRGTAFQMRVWRALTEIPAGKTVSYSELAARLGIPSSTRAVAGAVAANRIAVAIPCHRVVRSDGSISGYRWGVDRKRTLLDRELSPPDA
ncbi:bifunctional DNA-binding transcriptional regulator/O6-methylguanine-DNA methyltransferase Ada [Isosphaeraceae bacterium EP7]